MPALDKQIMLQEIEKEFTSNSYAFVSNFNALDVEQVSGLRRDLEKVSSRTMVVKTTVARKVLEKLNLTETEAYFNGPMMITFGDESPQEISKVIAKHSKAIEGLKPAGVVFEGKAESVQLVNRLSQLPSRQELVTQVLVRMNSPIVGFVTALGGISRGLVVALNEIRKKKEAAPAAS